MITQTYWLLCWPEPQADQSGRGSWSCPHHLQTTPETSPLCARGWRHRGAGKANQAGPCSTNTMKMCWHIVWELLNVPRACTVALYCLPCNFRQKHQGGKHLLEIFTAQENFWDTNIARNWKTRSSSAWHMQPHTNHRCARCSVLSWSGGTRVCICLQDCFFPKSSSELYS